MRETLWVAPEVQWVKLESKCSLIERKRSKDNHFKRGGILLTLSGGTSKPKHETSERQRTAQRTYVIIEASKLAILEPDIHLKN